MKRLQDEQLTLRNIFLEHYFRLVPATRDRVARAIDRYHVSSFLCMLNDDFYFFSSIEADILKCRARYDALPPFRWLQLLQPEYAIERFSLCIAVRDTLRRLQELQREIKVCHLNLPF
jgi:hypothetical protein